MIEMIEMITIMIDEYVLGRDRWTTQNCTITNCTTKEMATVTDKYGLKKRTVLDQDIGSYKIPCTLDVFTIVHKTYIISYR